jgi:cobalt-zinc-cadmium resistance protein CzcA
VVLLGAGIFAWQKLPIDAFPDVTNVQVMILAEAPGLAPSEVERLITAPIEIEMGGLPKVKQVRSSSKAGLSQVIIVFEDDADTYFTRQVVFERLAAAKEELPEGVEPEMGPISTGLGEIYQYALESGYLGIRLNQVTTMGSMPRPWRTTPRLSTNLKSGSRRSWPVATI